MSDSKELKLGPLERLMLRIVIQLGDNAYGVTIQKKVEEVNEKPLAVPLLYTTLNRLVEKGALIDRLGPATPVRGGRPKRLYHITAKGQTALNGAEAEEYRRRQKLGGLVGVPSHA
jgi:PadR family transcriptional regulator PadR